MNLEVDGAKVAPVRYCVWDPAAKKARYEVQQYAEQTPLVVHFADEGPKEEPAYWHLSSGGYRFRRIMDPFHKGPRDMYQAASEPDVNAWPAILDTTYCLNYHLGPFR